MLRKYKFLTVFIFFNLFLTSFNLNAGLLHFENEEGDYLKFGGAVRFNALVQNFEESNKSLKGAFDFDTFFITADASKFGFDLSLQYRFYPGSKTHFIHHAYFGYELSEKWYMKAGIIQKPFGVRNFASHSYFFQLPYYLGLEDRHSIGLSASYKYDRWGIDLAYFRQAEPGGPVTGEDCPVGSGRYSYAVLSTTGLVDKDKEVTANIRELDQFGARVTYEVATGLEIGGSAQVGRIYNRTLDDSDWGVDWAGHVEYNHNRWNFKGEVVGYNYKARSDEGQRLDAVQMGAYGSPYDVAAKGMMYVAGLAYSLPINTKFLQNITFYLDYTYLDKDTKGYAGTHHIIPGMMFTAGPIYAYLDYAMGKNQPWFSSSFSGLAEGSSNARWNSRLNLNVGYYF